MIESIQKQNFKHFQIILVDDLSDDGSFEIARKFQENDDRIILIKNTIKQRQGKAKNQAIEYVLWANTRFLESRTIDNVDFELMGGGNYIW